MNKLIFKSLKVALFFLAFSICFSSKYNNWILGLLYAIFVVGYFVNKSDYSFYFFQEFKWLLIANLFFIVVLGTLYSDNINAALKDIIRALPMLLTPLLFFSYKEFYKNFRKPLAYGLILGCFVAMLVCWMNVGWLMIINDEPISYLFRHRHLNHQLTNIIDIHASYLALFVITAVAIILKNYKKLSVKKKRVSLFLVAAFTLFLVALLARTLLLFYIVSIFVFMVINKYWRATLLLSLLIIGFFILIFTVDDQYGYLKNKVLNSISETEHGQTSFNRFDRLKATQYMFLEYPLFGVGTSDAQPIRQKYYLMTGDKRAYENKFNAHNQLFEYLDQFGLIGGLVFILVFVYSFKVSYKSKDYLFFFIVLLFFVANTTESMLQRTHGIIYFSVIFSVFHSAEIRTKNSLKKN